MQVIDPAVAEAEQQPPRLGADGQVEFHPAHHRAGRAVWATGIIGAAAREQATLLYQLAHAGEGGPCLPRRLHRRPRPRATDARRRRAARALSAAAARSGLRPRPAWRSVPDRASRRLGRRREPRRGGPGRRRLADLGREVVLLGRGRRPVRRHGAAEGRPGRDARDRLLPRSPLRRRLHDPPAEGQARDPGAGDR